MTFLLCYKCHYFAAAICFTFYFFYIFFFVTLQLRFIHPIYLNYIVYELIVNFIDNLLNTHHKYANLTHIMKQNNWKI